MGYYLQPWFDSLRRANRLTQGKKMHFVLICIVLGQKEIEVHGFVVQYNGEILDGDKATGKNNMVVTLGKSASRYGFALLLLGAIGGRGVC